jgi:3-oxoacyl-[acyl-carrier protein] reductase
MHPLFSLDGQTALVTGAGSAQGIGFAAAKLLAEMGAQVAITATGPRIHQRVAELQEGGHTARGYIVDLTDRPATRSMIEAVETAFGKIDILVNNAGMTMEGHEEESCEFAEMTDKAWDLSIARNLTTCYNVTRLVLPGMIRRTYGRIINVSSVTGPMVSSKGSSAYSAAKAAMVGMSRSIAIEVGMDNITINNVAPGWIATASQLEDEQIAARYTPLQRAGTPLETASLIAYLATPGASYITGQIMVVDGGNCLQEHKGP